MSLRLANRALLLTVAAWLLFIGVAHAVTLTVTTTTDGGAGSLRSQIAAANAGDVVFLPASAQHYQVTMGEIQVTQPITIKGAGASSSVIDASGGSGRVFHVMASPASTSTVTFQGVTIVGGNATTLPGGGAILVDGVSPNIAMNLSVIGSVITSNTVTVSTGTHCCAGGGGIYNNGGDITLTNSQVTHNTANVTGSTSSGAPTECCDGGGGVYDNYAGPLTLSGTLVNDNTVTVGGPAAYCCHGGGGIYNDNGGTSPTSLSAGSQVSGNSFTLTGSQSDIPGVHGVGYLGNCCSGGGAIYQDNNSDVSITNSAMNGNSSSVASGNCCHGGGAVYIDGGGRLTLTGSTQNNNTSTVNGPATTSATHALNHCCSGGGADATFGPATLITSTLDSNTSKVSSGNCCSGGGAIQIDAALGLSALDSTISNNRSLLTGGTESGGGGVYEDTGGGGAENTYTNSTISGNSTNASLAQGGGGGLYVLNGSQASPDVLANSTIAGNSASAGAGGGILNDGGKLSSKNSIVALNHAASGNDCAGTNPAFTFTSLGYNLVDTNAACGFTAKGDKVVPTGSVRLGPLANNGGLTFTRALFIGSAAIDAGNPKSCTDPAGVLLSMDQRGLKRPSDGRCDIGAFELQFPRPTCTLRAKSNTVLLNPPKSQARLKDALQLLVRCSQATAVKIGGRLTETFRKGSGQRPKTLTISPLSGSVKAATTTPMLPKLPKAALQGQALQSQESVTLTLTATNVNGTGAAGVKISKLKLQR